MKVKMLTYQEILAHPEIQLLSFKNALFKDPL